GAGLPRDAAHGARLRGRPLRPDPLRRRVQGRLPPDRAVPRRRAPHREAARRRDGFLQGCGEGTRAAHPPDRDWVAVLRGSETVARAGPVTVRAGRPIGPLPRARDRPLDGVTVLQEGAEVARGPAVVPRTSVGAVASELWHRSVKSRAARERS